MRLLITGTAGFIGFHLAKLLLSHGYAVHGYDGITDYYDVTLKKRRHELLQEFPNFSCTLGMLEDAELLDDVFSTFKPEVVIHLAAQAGVRYSLEQPRAYLDSNVIGTFNILDAARRFPTNHVLIASTSSVYGANDTLPFSELEKADSQLTIYAATKKAAESMAHSYSHLHKIPTTVFRFFTVYGPWGRPDMALFKFTEGILNSSPIDIYNNGNMYRDFTYVEDLVESIRLLIKAVPLQGQEKAPNDSLSPVAPFRTVNIGNSKKVKLLDFIDAIERELGKKAIRNYMPMQIGDVPATWADTSLLENIVGHRPATDFRAGVSSFVRWYREYYGK